ncbi:MAG: T9SS type A sorting domain-containing protein [Flavipsychrobacter sp.]|nr:T9SS type A sorting domain-containing protein [Flavipsychrobacter sp.]
MRRATMFMLFSGITANQSYNFNYAVDFAIGNVVQDDWNFNFWSHPINTDLIIFLQGWPSKKVYQSVVVPAAWPTNVKQIANELKVIVFPNPATDMAAVALETTKETNVRVAILDALGKSVYQKGITSVPGRNNLFIDTRDFSPGIYTVTIETDRGVVCEKLSVIK